MPSLWRQLISRLRSATLTLCQRRNNLESGEIEKKYIYIYILYAVDEAHCVTVEA